MNEELYKMKIEYEMEQTKNREFILEWNSEQREIALMMGMVTAGEFKEITDENFENPYWEENRF